MAPRKKLIGRPPKYKSPQDMSDKIDAYFIHCAKGEKIERLNKRLELIKYNQRIAPTMTGLSLFLGFMSNSSLTDYKQRHKDYSDIITCARSRVKTDLIQGAISGLYEQRTVQLILVTDYGMMPRTAVDVTSKGERIAVTVCNTAEALRAANEAGK